jgi:hypothetical protein
VLPVGQALIEETELSLKELARVGRSAGIEEFRSPQIRLTWTPLEPFDSWVLNLFAPNETIFWNFYIYSALLDSEYAFHKPFLSRDCLSRTDEILTALILEAGKDKRSDFASLLLGSWTARPEYFPPRDRSDVSFRSHRHRSMLVPRADRRATSVHFWQQFETFGQSSVKSCPDKERIADFDHLRTRPEYRLLADYITQFKASELTSACEQARMLSGAEEFTGFICGLDIRFGARGLFSVFPVPAHIVGSINMAEYADILRFRARVAVKVCSLPQIERLAKDVESADVANGAIYPDGVKRELLGTFFEALSPFRPLIDFQFPSLLPRPSVR